MNSGSMSHSASAKPCMTVIGGPRPLPNISLSHPLPLLFLQIIGEEVICLQATFSFSLLGASDVSMIEEQGDLYTGQGSAAQPVMAGDICMKTGHPAAAFIVHICPCREIATVPAAITSCAVTCTFLHLQTSWVFFGGKLILA